MYLIKKLKRYERDNLMKSYKELMEGPSKNMDKLHDLIKQGKSADEIAKLMKLDKDTIQALMEAKVIKK